MLEEIKITIGQASHEGEFTNWIDLNNRCKIAEPHKQLEHLYKTIETAKRDQSQFVVFPELFQPRHYLYQHIKAICEQNHFIMIGGLEYGPSSAKSNDKTTPLQNEAYIAIPQSLNWNTSQNNERNMNCTILTVPKILPAEEEESFIIKNNYTFKGGNKLYIFKSSLIGNWAVLICSDFLNLPIHVLLQAHIQTLFVISYNKDVNGYSSIADTIQRISMCNVVVCNAGYYGSSLVFSPYRRDFKRNKIKIIGNQIDVAVTVKVPLSKLMQAQLGKSLKDIDGSQLFIKRPPDFGKFHVVKEINREDNLGL